MEVTIMTGDSPESRAERYAARLERLRKRHAVAAASRNIASIACAAPAATALRQASAGWAAAAAATAAIALALHAASKKTAELIDDAASDLRFEEDDIERERAKKLLESSRTLQALKALEGEISTEYFRPGSVAGVMLRVETFESYWAMQKYIESMDRHVRDAVLAERPRFERALSRYAAEQAQKADIRRRLNDILAGEDEPYPDKIYARAYENMKAGLIRKIKAAAGCGDDDSGRAMLIVRCACKAGGEPYETYRNYGAGDIEAMLGRPEKNIPSTP